MHRRDFLGLIPATALAGVTVPVRAQGRGGGRGAQLAPEQRAPVTSTPPGARDRFVGMYTLVEYAPHGDRPTGRIYYDAAGRMGAMLHQPDRPPLPANPTVEDHLAANRGLVAYYGTYDVDPSTSRVVHHLEAASNPAWIGDDFVRWYEFEGTRLILRTSPGATARLVWERLPD